MRGSDGVAGERCGYAVLPCADAACSLPSKRPAERLHQLVSMNPFPSLLLSFLPLLFNILNPYRVAYSLIPPAAAHLCVIA